MFNFKKNFFFLAVVLSVFLITSCFNKGKKNLQTTLYNQDSIIVLTEKSQINQDTIKLTQVGKELKYILLERFDSSQIKNITKIESDGNMFFIHADQRLVLYSSEGQFIKEFTLPQYGKVWGFDLDKDQKRVFIATAQGILIYDYTGNYSEKIPLDIELEGIGNFFRVVNGTQIWIAIWNEGDNKNRLVVVDFDGSKLLEFPNYEVFDSPATPRRNASRFHRMLFNYGNEVRYHPLFSDTVFAIKDTILQPLFIERLVKKVPLNKRLEYVGDSKQFEKYCHENENQIHRLYETNDYWIITSQLANITRTFQDYWLIDKKTKRIQKHSPRPDYSKDVIHLGYFNDIDGGIALIPDFVCEEKIIGWYSAEHFKRLNNIGYRINRCEKNSSICKLEVFKAQSNIVSNQMARQSLENLLLEITDHDNPVLMILNLR